MADEQSSSGGPTKPTALNRMEQNAIGHLAPAGTVLSPEEALRGRVGANVWKEQKPPAASGLQED